MKFLKFSTVEIKFRNKEPEIYMSFNNIFINVIFLYGSMVLKGWLWKTRSNDLGRNILLKEGYPPVV